jgi:hypothetical protein
LNVELKHKSGEMDKKTPMQENNLDYCKCGCARIFHYLKHNEEKGKRNGGCRYCDNDICSEFRLNNKGSMKK